MALYWQPPPEHARFRQALRDRELGADQRLAAALEPLQTREDLDALLGPAIDSGHSGVVVFEGCGLSKKSRALQAVSNRVWSLNPAYTAYLVGDKHVVVGLHMALGDHHLETYLGLHPPTECARVDLLEDRIVRLEAIILGRAPAAGDQVSASAGEATPPAPKRPHEAVAGAVPRRKSARR